MTETTKVQWLQQAATADGNGTPANVEGMDRYQLVEVVETLGGTCTLALQGSLDGSTWYAVRYQRVDNTASVAVAVANLSVTASTQHVYQLLDYYPQVRAVVSSSSSESVNVKLYAVA